MAPFLHRGPNHRTTRLITTRDDAVLPKDATRIRVDAMTGSQAEAMLARGLPVEAIARLRPRLASLATRLGEWPLLLDLANGVLLSRVADGESPADALNHAERTSTSAASPQPSCPRTARSAAEPQPARWP